MNFGFSGEMIFIFFLALILFGPKKLPEVGRQVARFLNEFRRASNEFRSQIESEINSLDAGNAGNNLSNNYGRQILPPTKAPLGSLATRIFNPPSTEKMEAAEDAAAEAAAVKAAAAESAANKSAAEEVSISEGSPSPVAPKVAPDA
jgi:sec-independent protein translocase protein TatB